MFSARHQRKFVVKPPISTTTSTGSPCHNGAVPCFRVSALMGAPAARPYAKQALMTPDRVATAMPFFKSNSSMAAFCCSGDMARSLKIPARPAAAMPSKQTKIPRRMTRPELVPRTCVANTPLKMGGISVPNAAHSPRATAIPRERPRKRMVRPNVSPPIPHSRPKKNAQNNVLVGASDKTESRSRVIR